MVLILNREDVMSVLKMDDCIAALESAFRQLAEGTAVLPLRTAITPPDGLSLYMPAYLPDSGALACKVVTVYKNNPSAHNLPTTIGTVLLQEPETGKVNCIMDGGYLTAMRTGAVSGLATKLLARENQGQVAAIFGAGVMAQMQLEAVATVRNLSSALVFDLLPEASEKYAKTMSEKLGLKVSVAANSSQMLEADIICTASSSPTPIFDGKEVNLGTHINGIGSHSPSARELDTTIIKRAYNVVDSREACLAEAGDYMIPIADGEVDNAILQAELGEVVAGTKPKRTDDEQITLFKSNGLAIQDAATAKLIHEKALEAGIGTNVEI